MRHVCKSILLILTLFPSFPVYADIETIDIDRIPVCYNFACNTREIVGISTNEWTEVVNWFQPPALNAVEERKQIQHAIGWLEVVVGRYTPIHLDNGQNKFADHSWGQMDCIDESINVTTFLKLLERYQLLRFHRVLERAYRRTMWDQHWAGQIEERDSGKHWVVDSWFQGFGKLPYLQETEQWKDIPFFFTSFIDNSTD